MRKYLQDSSEIKTLEQSLNLNLYSLEQTRRLAAGLSISSSADSILKKTIVEQLNDAERILLDVSEILFDSAEAESIGS